MSYIFSLFWIAMVFSKSCLWLFQGQGNICMTHLTRIDSECSFSDKLGIFKKFNYVKKKTLGKVK